MEHFDKLAGGKYKADYFDSDKEYYSALAEQIACSFGYGDIILDVGAGPGCSAMLANDMDLEVKIIGLEPSDLYKDSEKLSSELKENGSCVDYVVVNAGVGKLDDLYRNTNLNLDGVIISRALHEIARSIGSIKGVYDQLKTISRYVKKEGFFVVGESQFTKEAMEHPYSDEVIKAARKCTEAKYGHSSGPEEFVTRDQFEEWMISLGYGIHTENNIEDLTETFDAVRDAGFKLEKSPYESYFLSMIKTNIFL
jgi:ubiquinone/menaquinone biosynthesis C-methylase UbiE